MSFPANKLVYIAFTAFFLLGAYNMAQTTIEILNSSKRLDNLKGEVSGLQTQKEALEKSIEYKKTSDYIEERARNALNMVKPGEKVFVATSYTDQTQKSQSEQVSNMAQDQQSKSHLREWLDFLF